MTVPSILLIPVVDSCRFGLSIRLELVSLFFAQPTSFTSPLVPTYVEYNMSLHGLLCFTSFSIVILNTKDPVSLCQDLTPPQCHHTASGGIAHAQTECGRALQRGGGLVRAVGGSLWHIGNLTVG